jgi:hypothetical protein
MKFVRKREYAFGLWVSISSFNFNAFGSTNDFACSWLELVQIDVHLTSSSFTFLLFLCRIVRKSSASRKVRLHLPSLSRGLQTWNGDLFAWVAAWQDSFLPFSAEIPRRTVLLFSFRDGGELVESTYIPVIQILERNFFRRCSQIIHGFHLCIPLVDIFEMNSMSISLSEFFPVIQN